MRAENRRGVARFRLGPGEPVLVDLCRRDGKRIEAFFTGRGHTQSWLRNRYALGEAAVFTPRQFTELHPSVTTPEGPVHFAGEHTSLKHSWIEGALESAVRVALEVNTLD